MTANLYQGEGSPTQVVGYKSKGRLPHPPIQAMKQTDTKSDMQFQMENEQKQHQQAYEYAHGHNDHGMGQ